MYVKSNYNEILYALAYAVGIRVGQSDSGYTGHCQGIEAVEELFHAVFV